VAHKADFSITDVIRAVLRDVLDEFLDECSGHVDPVPYLEQSLLLLQALPLDTTEYGLAMNRLANARHYLESAEYGAARFELRLLRRSLEH
jgi:hypothetical protein